MVSEKEKFTRGVVGKHRAIFEFIEKYPKISKYKVVQLHATKAKMAKCYSVLCYFQFFNKGKDTFAVLSFSISMLNSPVSQNTAGL